MAYAFCYALCPASTMLLTTRMSKLRLRVGMRGFGIGVVFEASDQVYSGVPFRVGLINHVFILATKSQTSPLVGLT